MKNRARKSGFCNDGHKKGEDIGVWGSFKGLGKLDMLMVAKKNHQSLQFLSLEMYLRLLGLRLSGSKVSLGGAQVKKAVQEEAFQANLIFW